MEADIDVIALAVVVGSLTSIAMTFLLPILDKLGITMTKGMKRYIISPILAFIGAAIYISIYDPISVNNETDWGAVFLLVLMSSQAAYNMIIPILTNALTNESDSDLI